MIEQGENSKSRRRHKWYAGPHTMNFSGKRTGS